MNLRFTPFAAALLTAGALPTAQAVDLAPQPLPATTAQERAAARAERKETVLDLRAKGQLPRAGGEYERQLNYPRPVPGTHEERRAERREIRRELSEPEARAAILGEDDEWSLNANDPRTVDGTHATRSADRQVRRAALRELVRTGQMPVSNEADVMRLPR